MITMKLTIVLGAALIYSPLFAQDVPHGVLDKAKVNYSPYPEQNYPNQVFFGDTHLHTSYSTDAGMIGNMLGPDEAYRFAKGETVTSSTGLQARLSRPLDFLVVADHAENLGLAPAIAASDPIVLGNEFSKRLYDLVKSGEPQKALEAFDTWVARMTKGVDPLQDSPELQKQMWHRITEAAERHNQPGQFTAFIGFEWTASPDGNNLHRNVIFRGGKAGADKVVPFSVYDSNDPEDLWEWMAKAEQITGQKLLAIPHNGNMSSGLMFDEVTLTTQKPLDRSYAEARMKWEPIYEVTQMKGDGEVHPALSPNDEFADFDTWDIGGFGSTKHTPDMLPKEYARSALLHGLAYDATLGANPFKFGMIGSTDAHTSLATTEENNFFGKVVLLEPSANPIRFEEVIAGRENPDEKDKRRAYQTGAAGLAGVWARENTRAALWGAMARKEVFATTGTRLRVRVFGGFDFEASDLVRSDFAKYGYDKGVPMGGDLQQAPESKAPAFLVRALRDPDGANLDRVQIIKGWLDGDGKTQEKIYDIAVSGGRAIGPDGRAREPVGNTVNVEEASYTNAIGAPFLQAFWTDPDFDPAQRAFYYVRVLEIPTPRWTTIDAKVFGVERPEDVPASIQERAYTSPIWYTPES